MGPSSSLVSRCRGSRWPLPPPRPSRAVLRCGAADGLCPRPSPEAHPSGRCWACKVLGRQLRRSKQTASTPGEGRLRHEAGASWRGRRGRPAGSRGNRPTRPVSRWARDRAPFTDPAGLGPLSWCCPAAPPLPRMANYPPPHVSASVSATGNLVTRPWQPPVTQRKSRELA